MKGKKNFSFFVVLAVASYWKIEFSRQPQIAGKVVPECHTLFERGSINHWHGHNYDQLRAAPLQETPKRKSQIPITRKNGACLQP